MTVAFDKLSGLHASVAETAPDFMPVKSFHHANDIVYDRKKHNYKA